ncbi:MAG: PQQ-dependent sugar dehydrogenase [Alphaproteobacteria bacterium]|nr:PQQ-dependent sugar dehydrogenase [Alphaproteobacteria bacterium]
MEDIVKERPDFRSRRPHGVRRAGFVLAALAMLTPACGPKAQPTAYHTRSDHVRVETVAGGLEHPWAVAFLPDGRMLVTERAGRLRVVAKGGKIGAPIANVPRVYHSGQGGLLDVALSPSFAKDRLVYLSFAESGDGGASTAVVRGRLNESATSLESVSTVFRQLPKVFGSSHFGSRLAFARDGRLFLTMGDRGKGDPAQDLSNHIGTIVRIEPDGKVPSDNPFVGRAGARPEIWSYGHRNGQGAALHPETGVLWMHEHGPRGGDEINIPEAGKNYGWPLVSWGTEYSGWPIPDPPTRPELVDAIYQWTPVIAASGMAFYTGDLFPEWRGNLLVGGLMAEAVVRLTLDGNRVTAEERIPIDARVRDVRMGPDGAVYVLTDEEDGRLLRLSPAG